MAIKLIILHDLEVDSVARSVAPNFQLNAAHVPGKLRSIRGRAEGGIIDICFALDP